MTDFEFDYMSLENGFPISRPPKGMLLKKQNQEKSIKKF